MFFTHRISGMTGRHKTFLSGAIALAVIVGGAMLGVWASHDVLPSTGTPEHLSAFEKGQYHFGHGDDGRYNLSLAQKYLTESLMGPEATTDRLEQVSAWYQLARIDFIEGRFDASIYKCHYILENFSDLNLRPYYILGLAHAYKAQITMSVDDWTQAEEAFLKFLADKPESPWARTDLAWVYFSQGKYDEMVPVLEEGLQFDPESPWLLNMYGLALLNTEQTSEAVTVFEHALSNAEALTVADWGNAYPGNDEQQWGVGLESFINAIEANLILAKTNAQG